jgi:hypothetical protein
VAEPFCTHGMKRQEVMLRALQLGIDGETLGNGLPIPNPVEYDVQASNGLWALLMARVTHHMETRPGAACRYRTEGVSVV